jgi:hypothetical protein
MNGIQVLIDVCDTDKKTGSFMNQANCAICLSAFTYGLKKLCQMQVLKSVFIWMNFQAITYNNNLNKDKLLKPKGMFISTVLN